MQSRRFHVAIVCFTGPLFRGALRSMWGVEEHVDERRSGWRFDRHAEGKAVTMAYGMLQRAKESSYPVEEILRELCGDGETATIHRFISLLLEFLNNHEQRKVMFTYRKTVGTFPGVDVNKDDRKSDLLF